MSTKATRLEHIEADLLFSSVVVKEIQALESLKPHPSEIIIQRSEDLYINLSLQGTLGSGEMLQDRDFRLGTVSEGESTQGKSIDGIHTIHLEGIANTGRPISTAERGFKDKGTLFRVVEECQSGATPHSSIMYLLGRPIAILWGHTNRDFFENAIQLHRPDYPEMGPLQTIKFPATNEHGGGFSSDCLLLKSKYGTVLYSHGYESDETKTFQPSYLHFISGDGVQNEDSRREFLEAFNFAFGKRFIEIGHTELDESNAFIRRSSRTPYSYNLKREILTGEMPPSNIHTQTYENDVDGEKVSKLIDLYLNAKAGMNLSEVMWRIWTARAMPLGQQLVQYGAALETLINAWFDRPENDDRAVYVKKADFKAKTKSFLDQLRSTTFPPETTANWKKVIDQLASSNKLSLADRLKHFLNNMGLQSGEVEKALWEARNHFAHGNDVKDADAKKLVVLRRAYEAILNRCLLKIIGFDGKYRDYSCLDFPERPLEHALAGPNGDGKFDNYFGEQT